MGVLRPRQLCYDAFGGLTSCGSSSWYIWGRWVAFGVVVGVALIAAFIIARFNARRRRRYGMQPYRGTAWMAPPPTYNEAQYQPPPPRYMPNPEVDGYYGGPPPRDQNGIELQPPPTVYYGGESSYYRPPPGPPPNNKTFS